MTQFTRRKTLLALAAFCLPTALPIALPTALAAAPTRYRLDTKTSQVGFSFILGGTRQKGTMPIKRATITLDPDNLGASKIDVTLNVAKARTGLPFATQALTGPQVLDAAKYPTIRFVSNRVKLASNGRLSDGARISGNLTMHGVTRPITLNANLYRARGSAVDDLSNLTVQLTGEISRSAFGASGHADLVADIVALDIRAVISAAK